MWCGWDVRYVRVEGVVWLGCFMFSQVYLHRYSIAIATRFYLFFPLSIYVLPTIRHEFRYEAESGPSGLETKNCKQQQRKQEVEQDVEQKANWKNENIGSGGGSGNAGSGSGSGWQRISIVQRLKGSFIDRVRYLRSSLQPFRFQGTYHMVIWRSFVRVIWRSDAVHLVQYCCAG